jgi:hypothetical protein
MSQELIESKDKQVNPYEGLKEKTSFLGRMTVVESVYYQANPEEEPQGIENRYVLIGGEDEQVYSRLKIKADETWRPIDTGWIEKPFIVVIKNRAGIYTQVNPTEEQVEEDKKKVLQINYEGLTIITEVVYPRCSSRVTPSYLMANKLQIRCNFDHTFYDLYAYPGSYKL